MQCNYLKAGPSPRARKEVSHMRVRGIAVPVDIDKIFGSAGSSNIANGDGVLRVWRMHAPDSLSRSAAVCAENGVWAWACLVGATGGGRGRGRGRSAVGLHLLACSLANMRWLAFVWGLGLGLGLLFSCRVERGGWAKAKKPHLLLSSATYLPACATRRRQWRKTGSDEAKV